MIYTTFDISKIGFNLKYINFKIEMNTSSLLTVVVNHVTDFARESVSQ